MTANPGTDRPLIWARYESEARAEEARAQQPEPSYFAVRRIENPNYVRYPWALIILR